MSELVNNADIYCSERGKALLENCLELHLCEYLEEGKPPKDWFIVSDGESWIVVLHKDDYKFTYRKWRYRVLILNEYENKIPDFIELEPGLNFYYVDYDNRAWRFQKAILPYI